MLAELEQAVLLATLRLDGEGYGLTIRDEIARATGRDLAIGTIHKTLTRLEVKELVASRMGAASPHTRISCAGASASALSAAFGVAAARHS